MITVNTEQAISDLKKFFEPLTPKQAHTAVARSINETLTTGRAQLVREITSVYTIKPALARQQLSIVKSNVRVLEGKIMGHTRRHSLSDFKNSQFTGQTVRSINTVREGGKPIKRLKVKGLTARGAARMKAKSRTGLAVEIRKGQSAIIPSAFLMQSRGGVIWAARGAYNSQFNFVWRNKRVSKSGNDLPANKLLTMSIYASAINKTVQQGTEPRISERYLQRLTHNLTEGIKHRGKYA